LADKGATLGLVGGVDPRVWLWDWSMIASNSFQMTVMAVSHGIFQLWEAWVEAEVRP